MELEGSEKVNVTLNLKKTSNTPYQHKKCMSELSLTCSLLLLMHTRNELSKEEQIRIREVIGDPAVFKAANIVRIDRNTFEMKTDGKPQQELAQFHWAWHSGSCNGLKDRKWDASDGKALFMNMKADALRLKTLGILQEAGSIAIDIGEYQNLLYDQPLHNVSLYSTHPNSNLTPTQP